MSNVIVDITQDVVGVNVTQSTVELNVTTSVVSVSAGSTGAQGPQGTQGVGYNNVTSTSSVPVTLSLHTWTVANVGAFVAGMRIRAIHTDTPSIWLEGFCNVATGTTIIITADKLSGSGTHNTWKFASAGEVGNTGATGAEGPSGVIAVTLPITNSGTSTSANIGIDQTGLTLAQSQITNLITDLAGKSSTASVALKANLAGGNTFTGTQLINGLTVVGANSPFSFPTGGNGTSGQAVLSNGSASTPSWGSIPQLAGGNAFTEAQTITGTVASSIPVIIKGASGQANDLLSVQNTGGTPLMRVNLNGSAFFGTTTGNYPTFFGLAGALSGMINVVPASAGVIPIIIRGAASQTADLQQWQNSAGSVLSNITSSGVIRSTVSMQALGMQSVSDGSAIMAFSSNRNLQIGATTGVYGGGQGVIGITSATTVPTSNPTGGGILYVEAGALNYRGTSGSAQTIANADGTSTFAKLAGGNAFTEAQTITGTVASSIPVIIKGASGQTANLQSWQNTSSTVLASISSTGRLDITPSSGDTANFRNAGGGLTLWGGNSSWYMNAPLYMTGGSWGLGRLGVDTSNPSTIGVVVRGAASQTANLQEWQNSAGTILAKVGSGGVINAIQVATTNGYNALQEASSGGNIFMSKMSASATNPGANNARLYFRDGTTAGTLKLVVRAGVAGAETTILDNIPTT